MTLFLIYATANRNYPRSSHPAPPAFCVVAHPWLFLRLQLQRTFFASLIVLFLPFSVSVVLCLLENRVFLRVSSRETIHTIFPWGAFLYSGFTFSHYELPFLTCDCTPYVRSALYQLVICVKGIRVCTLHCICAVTSFRIGFEVLSIGVDTTFLMSRVWYHYSTDHVDRFLLSRHLQAISAAANQKLFGNKDCAVHTLVHQEICEMNYKAVRAKRLASVWQLKMSGSFGRELEQHSYND